jgi:hypothetical protein
LGQFFVLWVRTEFIEELNLLWPVPYGFALSDLEPEPKLHYGGGFSQIFWLLAASAPQHYPVRKSIYPRIFFVFVDLLINNKTFLMRPVALANPSPKSSPAPLCAGTGASRNRNF